MARTKHAVVLALVATSLCVDRTIAAVPVAHAPVQQMARDLAERLGTSLRQGAPVATFPRQPGPDTRNAIPPATATSADPVLARNPIGPFQFRLPPPLG